MLTVVASVGAKRTTTLRLVSATSTAMSVLCTIWLTQGETTDCAEIINTLTNGMFMYLGWKGLRNCISEGHDRIFLITFLGYLLVGCGSFLFHATLWCRFPSTPPPSLLCLGFVQLTVGGCRFDAASRRTEYDIHYLFDVLG